MSDPNRLAQSYYNRWAGLYDRVATAPGVDSWRERVADSLRLSPGDTVVEMGCGTGANFPALRERVGASGRVVGLDLVPGMLGAAQQRIERNGWANVHLARADAAQPPVDGADAIVSTFLIGMLPDPGTAVREWTQRVASGGRVALLNAGRSKRLAGRPLNLGLRLFVRAGAPGARLSRESPVEELEARWTKASEALLEATVDHKQDRLGFGFVRLVSGQVPE